MSQSAANSAMCTEENYRRLQLKTRDQAKRLIDLQNQLKNAHQQVSQLSEAQPQQISTSQVAKGHGQKQQSWPQDSQAS